MVALEASKLFGVLGAEERQCLRSIVETRKFEKGESIFSEGDPGDGMYVVGQGRVQISAVVGRQEHTVLSHLGPGEFFGEMAVLDGEPRSASATAEEATELAFIPRGGLLSLLGRSPELALSLVREFSQRLREFDRQYIQEILQYERLSLVGRFARSIVHDFKNPLAIIGLAAELGASEGASGQMRQVAKERIRRQVERLSNMINELLEFTRGSQTASVLAMMDFQAYVLELVEEIRPEVAEKSVALITETQPPSVRLLMDPRRLTHVFYNLIHNAVDAMPGGGKITLRFALNDTAVITEVADSGPGIDPQIADRLFEPFATYGKSKGTGLGLSICQRIIHDHGGQITARNEPGQGAVFTFSLPRKG